MYSGGNRIFLFLPPQSSPLTMEVPSQMYMTRATSFMNRTDYMHAVVTSNRDFNLCCCLEEFG